MAGLVPAIHVFMRERRLTPMNAFEPHPHGNDGPICTLDEIMAQVFPIFRDESSAERLLHSPPAVMAEIFDNTAVTVELLLTELLEPVKDHRRHRSFLSSGDRVL
jgi:hypothetical protein